MSTVERYSRQLLLPEFGIDGQQTLMGSKVLVVGAGGLGSPNVLYLAGAGVGRIDIIDGDTVDISNLHRQPAHTTADVGKDKAISAAEKARAINPLIDVRVKVEWFNADVAREIVKDYDIIVDAVDNFPVKYLINDACVLARKPFVHAGVVGWKGQIFTHGVGDPCLRCLVSEPTPRELAPTCSRAGILGAMAGVMGSLQALEVIKYLACSNVANLSGRLLQIDGRKMRMKTVPFDRRHDCDVCGTHPTITEVNDVEMPVCDIGGKQ